MPDYRLIVCFDIEADDLKEAYAKLEQRLNKSELAWETSDEWYSAAREEAGDPEVLQKAIVAYFMDRQHDRRPCRECGHAAKEHKGNGSCSIAKSDTSTGYKSVPCPCPGLRTVHEDAQKSTATGASSAGP